jgi:anti-sigma B factor antagonist
MGLILNTCYLLLIYAIVSEKREERTSIKIEQQLVGDVVILHIAGCITLGQGSSAFREEIRELVQAGHRKILLDLGETSYMDSSGIGELISSFGMIRKQGGQLKIGHIFNRIRDQQQVTGFYTFFEVYDDEAAAVRSFI